MSAHACGAAQCISMLSRHYTFYLWKDFLGAHPAARFTLVPAYVYSGWSFWEALLQDRRTPVLWVLGFVAACAAALLPAWLLEPRCDMLPVLGVCPLVST